jgi:pSer/pThr/pTyr-binding forkhead associated (FHA) protein
MLVTPGPGGRLPLDTHPMRSRIESRAFPIRGTHLLMQAKLIPVDGGETITLERDVTLVGRKPGLCDLIVDSGKVSKLHCLIVKTDGLLFIRDLASTNGTKVNGQRVTRGALLPGDELAFANAKYRVFLGPSEVVESTGGRTEMLDSVSDVTTRPREADDELFADPDSDSDVRLLTDDSVV